MSNNYSLSTINKIQSIKMCWPLYDYIREHPNHVHLCMVHCSWSAFDYEMISTIINETLLDPYEKNSIYDFQEEKDNCFLDHCNAIYEEKDEDIKSNLEKIISYIKMRNLQLQKTIIKVKQIINLTNY